MRMGLRWAAGSRSGVWCVAVLLTFLCGVFTIGAEGSRTYSDDSEHSSQDELGLLVQDVLSRPMPSSRQDLAAIAESLWEWKKEQGVNTPEDETENVHYGVGNTQNDIESTKKGIENHYGNVVSCVALLVPCAVLLGTVMYLRGFVTVDPAEPAAPHREPQEHSSPYGSSLTRNTDRGNSDSGDVLGGEESRRDLVATSSAPSDEELLQVLSDRFEYLKLQPDPASKKERAKLAGEILKHRRAGEQTIFQMVTAEATKTIALVKADGLRDRKSKDDDAEVAQWHTNAANALWILVWAWIAFEIYYRGLRWEGSALKPGPWLQMLPSGMTNTILWAQRVGWVVQLGLLAVVAVFPLAMVIFVQTSLHVVPYYLVCGAFWWYLLESHVRARLIFCLVRPWGYAVLLAAAYWASFQVIQHIYRGSKMRDAYYPALAVVVVACLAACGLGWFIAATDAHLPGWEVPALHLTDTVYLWATS